MPKTAKRRDLGRHTVSAQLRDVIDSRGLTPYAVAKLSDIDPGMVARFVSGERDLRLGTVDRIAAALGLRLVEVGRAREWRFDRHSRTKLHPAIALDAASHKDRDRCKRDRTRPSRSGSPTSLLH